MRIKSVIIFSNGVVMSFDDKGEQVSECEGFILDIADKLKEFCDKNTEWSFGKINEGEIKADFLWYWQKEES